MNLPVIHYLSILIRLAKIRITFLVMMSCAAGYILFSGKLTWHMLISVAGIFLLAGGAAALNQYQERELDALMTRTKTRPLPAGDITPGIALTIIVIFICSGSLLLFICGILTLNLGLFTLFWYNGVYTKLKRHTIWAAIPGGLIGALPPVIGWVAAGGHWLDKKILLFALFFFLWQIPHFWLILLMYDRDYRHAQFPSLLEKFSTQRLAVWICAWTLTAVVTCLVIAFDQPNHSILLITSFCIVSIVLIAVTFRILKNQSKRFVKTAFIAINMYTLFIVIFLSIDALLESI